MVRTEQITTPLRPAAAAGLRAGDHVLLTGVVHTARDAAHRRLIQALEQGERLPFDPRGGIIYYVGPCPARPGRVIGAAGPTSSYRLDPYTPPLLAAGLAGMIGKGPRGPSVIEAIKHHGAVYFLALGGAGALLAGAVSKCEVVAYPDLGPEAVHRLEVVDFPLIVGVDSSGADAYALARTT